MMLRLTDILGFKILSLILIVFSDNYTQIWEKNIMSNDMSPDYCLIYLSFSSIDL